ncbi:hypothetical protein KI387_010431 [Taxus chinensis]|uniref:HMA domain-containing protein n=1 Tax=Taxus chinensis TaxID=29808 RepID=A0AA38FL43_TAXCH|nr:hypothetical protein KI387_010431 [Taxus chinensis]
MVLKVSIEDEKSKRRALEAVAGVQGVDSVAIDMKENKITVIGEADPVYLTAKLRKFGHTELLSVGPAKEEKKEPQKQEPKKEEQTVVYVPSNYSYNYRPYEYTVVRDEYNNSCTIC